MLNGGGDGEVAVKKKYKSSVFDVFVFVAFVVADDVVVVKLSSWDSMSKFNSAAGVPSLHFTSYVYRKLVFLRLISKFVFIHFLSKLLH